MSKMFLRIPGMTLMELLIAIVLLSVVVLAINSIDLFSHFQVLSSERRSGLQNELSYALEHMGKNVMQGVGASGANQPPIEIVWNLFQNRAGFRVRVDRNNPTTPQNLNDDLWFYYTLPLWQRGNANLNTLSFSCTNSAGGASALCPPAEVLSTHILSGVSTFGPMLDPPQWWAGFFIDRTENNTVVEVGLVARLQPTQPASPENPQVQMKARLYTRSASVR